AAGRLTRALDVTRGMVRMIRGSCLCGGVRFEFTHTAGPFELCHCNRCRKVSGSAYRAGLLVQGKDFHLTEGKELIKTFEAPIVEALPPYHQCFCGRCGCPIPNPAHGGAWFVPAGLLDDDPKVRPDKHIYVELKAPWDTIADQLPQMTKQEIWAHRARASQTKA
ncbi:MAG: GFA family protein, partial [Gammaproteobacteria bacterium]